MATHHAKPVDRGAALGRVLDELEIVAPFLLFAGVVLAAVIAAPVLGPAAAALLDLAAWAFTSDAVLIAAVWVLALYAIAALVRLIPGPRRLPVPVLSLPRAAALAVVVLLLAVALAGCLGDGAVKPADPKVVIEQTVDVTSAVVLHG